MSTISKSVAVFAMSATVSFTSIDAFAQANVANEPTQLLGTVEAFGADTVLEMQFDDPDRLSDFELVFSDMQASTDFVACARIPNEGINCLDQSNKVLKRFDESAGVVESVLNCLDIPGLDGRHGGDCIAFSYAMFDGAGIRAIVGNEKGKSYNLYGVFEPDGACPAGTAVGTSGFCANALYMGRPLLLDLKPVQGDLAANFPLGPGFSGVEQRGDFVHFAIPVSAEPTVVADKKDFGLKGNVSILGGDILQLETEPDVFVNYALITTDEGKLLAHEIDGSGDLIEFDLTTARDGLAACNSGDPNFGIRVDPRSDIAIITDAQFCLTSALAPTTDADGYLAGFDFVQEETAPGVNANLILSTGNTAPVGAISSPGKFLNLVSDGCQDSGGCTVVPGEGGVSAATLLDVNVVDTDEANAIIYHVRGLVDCALRPLTCVTLLDDDPDFDLTAFGACANPGTISTRADAVDCLLAANVLRRADGSPGTYQPGEFERNYTPLLPDDVTNNFDDSDMPPTGIPPLWFQNDIRGRLQNEATLGLLFFVSLAREEDVLTLDFEVSQLQGGSLTRDCESFANGGLPADFDVDDPATGGLARLLDWDVAHRTSERYESFAGDFQGTIINAGCGSTRGRAGGISGFIYDAGLTPCPGTLDENGDLVFDTQGNCAIGEPLGAGDTWQTLQMAETLDDAVFAKAFVRRFVELRLHLDELLCKTSGPGADDAVLSQSDCDTLRSGWDNTQDKLKKAIDATIEPKESAGAQNFGAVDSQFTNYQTNLLAADRTGPGRPADPANHYGEHVARVETLFHLLVDKLEPSIPDAGFVESNRQWAEVQLPQP